jgi:hypothetical protein
MFSTAVFRPVALGEPTVRANSLIAELQRGLNCAVNVLRSSVVASAYDYLVQNHRTEYVYRNLITERIFVGKHRASPTTVMLNEFRIGRSFADCVVINGCGEVYEIKTELDSPRRLRSQLNDYFSVFTKVTVVVDPRDSIKYERYLPAHVGLATANRSHLSIIRPASIHSKDLNTHAMISGLRWSEIRDVFQNLGVSPPEIPNGLRFKAACNLAAQYDPAQFQYQMEQVLKRRSSPQTRDMLLSREFSPISSILLRLNPSPPQQQNLRAWLSEKVV